MRTYPVNSAEAAARIVAVALLADGHLCSSELHILHVSGCDERLGLKRAEFDLVVRHLAEDLMAAQDVAWHGSGALPAHNLHALFDEITDRQLQQRVLRLCERVTGSDAHLGDGERGVLRLMQQRWSPAPQPA